MKSKARIADHPLHPMMIVLPAGAFVLAFLFDLAYLFGADVSWWEATWPVLLVGVIGALLAAVPGLIDLIAVVPRQRATSIGITHMVLNLGLVALQAFNAWIRFDVDAPDRGAYLGFWLSLGGVLVLLASGWLGWKMVYEYHVGVLEHPEAKDPDPHVYGSRDVPTGARRPAVEVSPRDDDRHPPA